MTSASTTQPASATRHRSGLYSLLGRRWPTAVGLGAAAASVIALLPLPHTARAWAGAWTLLLAAVIYLTWGAVRGDLRPARWLAAQAGAVLVLGAVALSTLTVDQHQARFVLAAGWIAHAAWDAVHHRANRVVPRWYAEACAVVDLSVAAVLLTANFI
ncbi:hypothetical protein [Phycicoccus ginsengisoli]